MNYNISFSQPFKKLIHVRMELAVGENTILRLPAWRPGRYELQNYAANILAFHASDEKNNTLRWIKTAPTIWEIDSEKAKKVVVQYSFYANRFDAGGCFLDEDLVYINFINCLMYPDRGLETKVSIHLDLPAGFQIAGDTRYGGNNTLVYNNYYEVFDSPIIASDALTSFKYTVAGTEFNAWFYGLKDTDFSLLAEKFDAFTRETIGIFGPFPNNKYDFLFLIPSFHYYHGVEHRNSTVIVLGPETEFDTPKFENDLLGISCHELFHAWNICRIRPTELLPYDFSTFSVFETGYVAEGVTTYYGDWLLLRSHVFSEDRYFEEFNHMLERHFWNFGRFNSSVAQSSMDLWVDGYVAGIPNKKVSIYNEGALAAFILDIEIRKYTQNERSLDDLMRLLWKDFGQMKQGYSPELYQKYAEKIAGKSLKKYFQACINGTDGLGTYLHESVDYLGLQLQHVVNEKYHASNFGFLTQWKDGQHVIKLIEPNSPADNRLAEGDIILEINGMIPDSQLEVPLFCTETIFLQIQRNGKNKMISLSATLKTFLTKTTVIKKEKPSVTEMENYRIWAGK